MAANDKCPLREAVRNCLSELPAGSTGVVAVSGGPDSVALLRALVDESTGPLVVAHLNHQLRGQESDADEAFVSDLHSQLVAQGTNLLPFACERMDVRAAAVGENLESTARSLRYDWLARIAIDTGSSWVATGHTADDQAETVLHRLLRGTGLKGLAGIPRSRELTSEIVLVRPLLGIRRVAVLAFLKQCGQGYQEDSSNQDRRITRSRLRHDLLPLLAREYNPAVVKVLSRLAEQARNVQMYIDTHATKLLARVELPRSGAIVVLDANGLASESKMLCCEALRILWAREGWPLGEMGFQEWQRVLTVLHGEQTAHDLPGGVHIRRLGHVLQVQRSIL